MNVALIRKTARDALLLLLIAVGGITLLETLFVVLIREFPRDMFQNLLRVEFIRRVIRMMAGAEFGADFSATSVMSIGFAHPIMFALTWTYLLTTCTRVIAHEIDRGTADLLFSLPLKRSGIYVSVSLVWLVSGLPICAATVFGAWIGIMAFRLEADLDFARLAILAVNLLAMYIAIGGGTMLASSLASRRGPAVSAVLAVLLGSFLLNFLGQFWTAAERIGFLGLMHYYRPLPIIQDGQWPVANMTILVTLGLLCWLAGLICFIRRDIPAT